MQKEIITVYQPDNSLKNGFFLTFRQIYEELIDNKWLMYQLFKRDFSTMYKQSFIGFLWIFIMPITLNVGIFAMLGSSGIFNYGKIGVPYPVYAILGISLWQIFANGITSCGNSLSGAGDMITRINFSKKSLVLATIGKAIITFLVQISLVIVLLMIYRIVPNPTILLFPLVTIPIILLALGLGLIISILNSFIKDTGNLLSVVVMLGMYVTPVLYAKPAIGLLAGITTYNPMYYFICSGRDLALKGTLSEPQGFVISCFLSIFVFLIGLYIFHLTETRITERV